MARFIFTTFLLCLSTVFAHHEELLKKTETLVSQAKAHVEHMLDLDVPNKDKIPPIVLNETSHLAHEIRQLHNSFKEKSEGQDAKVSAAATELANIAATLDNPGTDPKEVNAKYFAASTATLEQLKLLASAGDEGIKTLVNGGLNGLSHDVDNYQRSVHQEVGSHDGHDHAQHGSDGKVHKHGAGSSEESSEEEGHSHSHHDHHNHDHHQHH